MLRAHTDYIYTKQLITRPIATQFMYEFMWFSATQSNPSILFAAVGIYIRLQAAKQTNFARAEVLYEDILKVK